MELRQLRYFVALAETRNFHRAAERLNMSQPPLTVAIRKLETELGAALFVRETRGVSLTPAGNAALSLARQTLAQADRFREAVREGATGERGRLRVGFVGSATFELLPRIIPEFRRRYPLVELVLQEAASATIADRLIADELDIGLVRLPLLDAVAIDTTVIDRDELHAVLPENSPFAKAGTVELADLAKEPFVLQSRISVLHSITLSACQKEGFVPIVAQEAEQLSAILSLVRSGLGVALVPARVAHAMPPGLRLVPLARRVPIETGLALPRGEITAIARNFAAIAINSD